MSENQPKKKSLQRQDSESSVGPLKPDYFSQDGHTWRFYETSHKKHTNMTIERMNVPYDLTKPVPVTAVDTIFDEGFAIRNQYGSERSRPLRTEEELQEVLQIFESTAIRSTKEYNPYHNSCTTTFEIPIIGHILLNQEQLPPQECIKNEVRKPRRSRQSYPNIKANNVMNRQGREATWLYYKGKYYDPDFLYVIHKYPFSLKALCPVATSEAYKEQRLKLGRIDKDRYRLATQSYSQRKQQQQKKHVTHSVTTSTANSGTSSLYLEIDLGEISEITHIGMLGGYPSWNQVYNFPPINPKRGTKVRNDGDGNDDSDNDSEEEQQKYGKGGRYYRIGKKVKGHVSVVEERDLGWVTEYSVQYRDITTRKWQDYRTQGHHLTGNTNMAEEVYHTISIYTRYLRIFPISWYQACNFTCLIYGHGQESKYKPEHSLLQDPSKHYQQQQQQQQQQEEELTVAGILEDEIETITYKIDMKDNAVDHHAIDGHYGYDSYYNAEQRAERLKQKQTLLKHVREEEKVHKHIQQQKKIAGTYGKGGGSGGGLSSGKIANLKYDYEDYDDDNIDFADDYDEEDDDYYYYEDEEYEEGVENIEDAVQQVEEDYEVLEL
jgi:hypothetical protein